MDSDGDEAEIVEGPTQGMVGNDLEITDVDMDAEFDIEFGLLTPEQTVLIKAYSDDADDKVLEETNPRFIVLYEPNPEFIRRIEVGYLFVR